MTKLFRVVVLMVSIAMLSLSNPITPVASAQAEAAQSEATPTTAPVVIREVGAEGGGIIPRPNSGTAPTKATDRGGALQLALLGLLLAFPVVAVVSIRRQGAQNRS